MQDTPFSWKCPFCDHVTTITNSNYRGSVNHCYIDSAIGYVAAATHFIVCPNPDCRQLALGVSLHTVRQSDWTLTGKLWEWPLRPDSRGRVFPDFVPEAIRNDYGEACRIRDLSPKSAAALARRCLQGMIRDFWSISKNRLVSEIEAIRDLVDPLTWEAIDGVRKVGNIGAHMEKDINLIIDVEPEEAGLLIDLVENLVEDWYIARHNRQQRLQSIVAMASEKDAERKGPILDPKPSE